MTKKIYPDHFNIDGNPINVITCRNCGNQVNKECGIGLCWYDENVKCCESPSYYYGIFITDYEE